MADEQRVSQAGIIVPAELDDPNQRISQAGAIVLAELNDLNQQHVLQAGITIIAGVRPPVPTHLDATAATDAYRIDLSWTDHSEGTAETRVERSTDGVTFTEITTVAAGVAVYADTSVALDVLYYYRVRTYAEPADSMYMGYSAYSNIASAMVVSVALCNVAYTLEIYQDGAWEDVTDDLSDVPTIRHGFAGPLARVAVQGTASFVLNNTSQAYSPPLVPGMVPHLPVRFKMSYMGTAAVLFLGTLRSIRPTPDICGVRKLVRMDCVDDMAKLDAFKGEIDLQTNTYADAIINAVVAAAYTPVATNYESGLNAFPVAADRWSYQGVTINSGRRGPTEMVTAAQKIEDATVSDWGHFFVAKDGTTTYYNRHHEILDTTTALTLEAMSALSYQKTEQGVINYIEVTCYPRTIGVVYEVLGRMSQQAAPAIDADTTQTYVLHFRDPANQGVELGALSPQVVTVAGAATDDLICTADPAGAGAYVAVTVVETWHGHRAEIAVTNPTAAPAYIQKLQVRGYAVRSREPVSVIAQDALVSIPLYGRQELPINAPLMSNPIDAQALANHLLTYYRLPLDEVPSVSFSAHTNIRLMEAAQDIELLQRAWIKEEQTGVEGFFYVYGINHQIRDNYNHIVTLALMKAYDIEGTPWIWDTSHWDGPDKWVY